MVERSTTTRPVPVAASLSRFAAAGTVVLLLLSVGAVLVVQRISRRDAVDDARRLSAVVTHGVLDRVTDGVAVGDPAARLGLDAAVRRAVLVDPVVRVKVWDGGGRILYSDAAALEGEVHALGDEEHEVLAAGGSDAEVSDLQRPENRLEQQFGSLLEVYQQVRTPSGQPLLFETYVRYQSVTARSQALLQALLPVLIGALVLLQALQLPLAWRLLRRVRSAQRDREVLLRRSLEASDAERHRIAGDLHDGVIQTLASASYQLAALGPGERSGTGPAGPLCPDERRTVDRAARTVRQSIRQLRSLVVEMYPASLADQGLGAALTDLLTPLAQRSVETSLHLPEEQDLPPDAEALLYRGAQEAVRNVIKHADASRVDIEVTRGRGSATLTVSDDGCGFADGPVAHGHVGLRLLADYAATAGGTVSCGNRGDGGAVVRVEVPVSR